MSYFSDETIAFLNELAKNNNREWFDSNRADYERVIVEPTKAFAMTMATALEAETGRYYASKIFRIFRDVRFSKDKRPYNTHIRISFTSEKGPTAPGYFFSLEQDHLVLGAGVFTYEKADLDNFRRRIDGHDGTELQKIAAKLAGMGVRLSDPELKRVPAPFPADHPQAELLRRKGLTAWIDDLDFAQVCDADGISTCILDFKKLEPLFDWMSNR
jgi:uncharacterized protein (TIGR02453 family)